MLEVTTESLCIISLNVYIYYLQTLFQEIMWNFKKLLLFHPKQQKHNSF